MDQPRLPCHPHLRFPRPVRADSHHAARRPANYVRHAQRNLRLHTASAHELFRPQPRRPPCHARDHRCRCLERPFCRRRRNDDQRFLPARRHGHFPFHGGPSSRLGCLRRPPLHLRGHLFLPQVCARRQPPHTHRHRPYQRLPPGIYFRHERGAIVQSRAQSPRRIREAQSRQHEGLVRRHPRLCAFLSCRRVSKRRDHYLNLLVRRQSRPLQRPQPRRAHRLHHVRHPFFPPHPGPQRKIQHPAIRHGRFRAHLQAPRRAHYHRFLGSGCPPRLTKTGSCAMSLSASSPARLSLSSATPAPARPLSSPCCSVSTTSSAARFS